MRGEYTLKSTYMVGVQLLGLFMIFLLWRCCRMLVGGTSGYGGAPVGTERMRGPSEYEL